MLGVLAQGPSYAGVDLSLLLRSDLGHGGVDGLIIFRD